MCVRETDRQTDRQKWQLYIIYETKERGLEGEDGIYVFFFFLSFFTSCNWYVGTVLFYMKCLESGVGGGGVHS